MFNRRKGGISRRVRTGKIRPAIASYSLGGTGGLFDTALAYAIRRAEKGEEFRAQHGPVKVLFKDGKPV